MIFSIEKRRFRRGEVEETRSYYLRYRIGDMPVDKWKSLGVTDQQVADQKLPDRLLVHLLARVRQRSISHEQTWLPAPRMG